MQKFLQHYFRHWFIPHESNNHRPKLLHHSILLSFILLFAVLGVILPPIKHNHQNVLGISYNISTNDLLNLTNHDRAANNLLPLSINQDLTNAASANGQYMFAKNYWSHFAPDGTSPWSFILRSGYSYLYAGQNLARGFTTASDVEKAWMTSPEHKDNILSSNYHDVGFAVMEGNLTGEDTVLVVEMFGSQASPRISQSTSSTTNLALAITSAPTPIPTNASPILTPTPSIILLGRLSPPSQKQQVAASQQMPLVDSASFSRNTAATVILLLILALVLDLIYIRRTYVVRFVAHNVDHLVFLGIIAMIIIFIINKGVIS